LVLGFQYKYPNPGCVCDLTFEKLVKSKYATELANDRKPLKSKKIQ
jgi:hypothetical protein